MFKSLFESRQMATLAAPVPVPTATAFDPEPGCSVAPLQPIDDGAAQQLEVSTGSNVVDVADMIPAAARALTMFQTKVASVGGTMILKSAYRPAAYQKHLQDVWYKWMGELKGNRDSACQVLRAQVQDEFVRHRLIETQHPVAVSDHTRGLAFDATVDLSTAKIGRRLTLDRLARLAGLLRPAIVADPVHFKFLGFALPRHLALRRRHFNG
jgi:D-alanyl-D-alanine dipeptidase